MKKGELVSRIATEAGISQKAADKALKAIIQAIHETLKSQDNAIRIPKLGTFKVAQRKARTGVNPRTRQKMAIPATVVPSFSAAKALREMVKD